MSKVYVSVVSHGHFEIIEKIGCLSELSSKYDVVVKSNVRDDLLREYCALHGIYYLEGVTRKGFGENNNDVFSFCVNSLEMRENDYFLVLNPDVRISTDAVDLLVINMLSDNISFSTINLFKDDELTVYDNSIRRFPSLLNFLSSYLLRLNPSVIDKDGIKNKRIVDWAAGSFLMFKASVYKSVCGFDCRFFMYCEDIDICLRLQRVGVCLMYYPDIKAVHYAMHKNRSVLSKHFFWHIRSIIRFLCVKNGWRFF
ncbi:glycosyltransferase family 2 protein [Plesiomonas shigelloides]|uniref:glycosyltransferase family 2 protein n=1 Tax=Plesiomonas shigelloides TaxID=703 RepID=UPI003EB7F103